jgi:4a-hydroxytetrahydrobiopterin dehydratase
MIDLPQMRCEVCQVGSPQASQEEIDEFMPQLKNWEIVEIDGIKKLRCKFQFANFKQALAFTNKVGELAEQHDHHPTLVTEWGQVTVIWWTHKINGLHVNDFVMAAKTDYLL